MDIKDIYKQETNTKVILKGWIRFNRLMKDIGFIELFDGSNIKGIQLVYKKSFLNENDFEILQNATAYSALIVEGILIEGKNDKEIKLTRVIAFDKNLNENILQKQSTSFEALREIAYLRSRTKTFQAIFKIRSKLMFYLHQFFNENDFVYVNSPIITSNDAEGAGEAFKVVTSENKDFFNKPASLSVSGQLHAEAFAQSFKKVYTFAPTFRAENSNTQKHASEFWMLEPEVAFEDYEYGMELSASMLSFVSEKIKKELKEEIEYLANYFDVDLNSRLDLLINKNIKKISYKKAIEILNENKTLFEEQNIHFGLDLGTEHEKFLATYYPNNIVFIYDYPAKIKAFYMKLNDDNETVRGFDLIIPEIGELIGGSEREDNYDKLLKTIEKNNLDLKDLEWYIELRKLGYLRSTGFGIGLERLLMFVTGVKNIRDTLPFPRTPGSIKY